VIVARDARVAEHRDGIDASSRHHGARGGVTARKLGCGKTRIQRFVHGNPLRMISGEAYGAHAPAVKPAPAGAQAAWDALI
jgi:hypothetical protein